MNEPVIFVVHGIGDHQSGWSQGAVQAFRDTLLDPAWFQGTDISVNDNKRFLDSVEFREILYDDSFDKSLKTQFSSLDLVAGWFETNQHAADAALVRAGNWYTQAMDIGFLKKNIWDIFTYRFIDGMRTLIKASIHGQIFKHLETLELPRHRPYYLLSHSLGTIATHDMLHDLGHYQPRQGENPFAKNSFSFRAFFAVANVCALARNDVLPSQSIVRPFLAPFLDQPGYVKDYVNINNAWDPVPNIIRLAPYIRERDPNSFGIRDLVVDHHGSPLSVHSFDYYLSNPIVAQTIAGSCLFPRYSLSNDTLAVLNRRIGEVNL